jgi:hypothetical protein
MSLMAFLYYCGSQQMQKLPHPEYHSADMLLVSVSSHSRPNTKENLAEILNSGHMEGARKQ